MWTIFTATFGAVIWGVLGIVLVLAVGLVLLLTVRFPRTSTGA